MKHKALVLATCTAAAAAAAAAPATAHAGDDLALVVDATMMSPVGKEAGVSESVGWGASLAMLPSREPMAMRMGGWFAVGKPVDGRVSRDVYDFFFALAFKPGRTQGDPFIPYIELGLDVLNVTSHQPDGATYRGTTLGIHARAGIFGYLGKQWIYSVGATYLGAVVPGTGDDLGGLVLQAGIGLALDP